MEIKLPNNTAWKKSEPPKLSYNPDTKMKCEMKRSNKRTSVWAVSRKHSEKGETIVPSWTGFQVLGQSKQPKEVSIGFIPAIPAPPTQKYVIEEIINRVMRCKSELQLESIFPEVDQAIYNKVLQVLFKSFCNKLIVRIGGFHIVLCLLKTIYSRFYDSGIVELLVEPGVGSEGGIRSAMKGSDVKFGIRCYKVLFEAILQTKIEFIMENVAEFRELPLLNNLKIANLCNEGACPEKVDSIINDVDTLPTLDSNIG